MKIVYYKIHMIGSPRIYSQVLNLHLFSGFGLLMFSDVYFTLRFKSKSINQ